MKEIVLVTGCCGRIGSNVLKRLSPKFDVFGLELSKELCSGQIIPMDLASESSVEQALSQIPRRRIASVIHLAAYYSFNEQHSDLYDQVTVQGTARLLKALQKFEVDQFLFSSTMLVHAPTQPGHPITERSPVQPSWDYPLSKVRTEALIHSLHGSMKTVILRIGGVYDDHCHSIPISHQIQRIYENKLEAHLFSGDISHGSSFIHMDDLVDAIELAVNQRQQLPSELVLLLGEEKTWSYDALQREISRLIRGREFKTWRIPKPIAKFGAWVQGVVGNPFIKPWMIDLADDHYELDISLAKQTLGWSPRRSLGSTLPKMINELKADPDAWYQLNQLK